MLVNHHRKGFTLIELIVGILLFGIALSIVITLVVNQTQQSISPVLQTRAAALAKSLSDEILGRAFDENSMLDGSLVRCGENGTACTAAASLGPEESRENYDDVDDYNNLFANSGGNIESALGQSITAGSANLYQGFSVDVVVEYDNSLGSIGKRVTISVTTPGNDVLDFTFFRMNY